MVYNLKIHTQAIFGMIYMDRVPFLEENMSAINPML